MGYGGSPLHYVDNNTLVYSTGNALTFVDSNGIHVRSVLSEGKGIGPVAVCPQTNFIAYAEASLEPLIFLLRYPQCSLALSLKGKCPSCNSVVRGKRSVDNTVLLAIHQEMLSWNTSVYVSLLMGQVLLVSLEFQISY